MNFFIELTEVTYRGTNKIHINPAFMVYIQESPLKYWKDDEGNEKKGATRIQLSEESAVYVLETFDDIYNKINANLKNTLYSFVSDEFIPCQEGETTSEIIEKVEKDIPEVYSDKECCQIPELYGKKCLHPEARMCDWCERMDELDLINEQIKLEKAKLNGEIDHFHPNTIPYPDVPEDFWKEGDDGRRQ